MKVLSSYMGEIECNEEGLIQFVAPILGFENRRKFVLVENETNELPFDFLQSVDDEHLTFIITSPFLFIENYAFDVPEDVTKALDSPEEDNLAVFNLVVIPENLEDTTINLKAPILINLKNRKAVQLILDEDYPYKKELFKRPEEK